MLTMGCVVSYCSTTSLLWWLRGGWTRVIKDHVEPLKVDPLDPADTANFQLCAIIAMRKLSLQVSNHE